MKAGSICIRILFCILCVPQVLFSLVKTGYRAPYLKYRHPRSYFAMGCYADDISAFEEGTRVGNSTKVYNTSMGTFSYLAQWSIVQNCTIGRYCSIGPETMIGLGIHATNIISTHPSFFSCRKHAVSYLKVPSISEYQRVQIGSDVWIGARVIIRDGVTVGDGAIIGAGSVVTKDVKPYTINAGAPAREIGRRFSEEVAEKLIEFAWWDRGVTFCKEHSELFHDPERFLELAAKILAHEDASACL